MRIDYSCLNYKDGLALTGRAPIFFVFPQVPGARSARLATRLTARRRGRAGRAAARPGPARLSHPLKRPPPEGLVRLTVEDGGDFVGVASARGLDLDGIAGRAADERAGQRRGDGEPALARIGLVGADDLVGACGLGVLVDDRDRRTELNASGLISLGWYGRQPNVHGSARRMYCERETKRG